MIRILALLSILCATGSNGTAAKEPGLADALRLFGVEIGGPEDGFALTDPAAFESAKLYGGRSIDLRPVWSALEPEPGIYDWTSLDAGLDNAAAVGLPVTVTVRFFDDQVPEWLTTENMLDQDGRPFSGYGFEGVHRSPSFWGPSARASYLRLVEELVKRYRTNPNILAWQFFYGYNDSLYMGMWNNRQAVYDYSPFSQDQYRHYLRRERGFSLRELNRRYSTEYEQWGAVVQPQPAFGELNVNLAWHDFQDYRMWSVERMFDDIDRTVRAIDRRPLIMYNGGTLHHAAHQLTVLDIGLRLMRKHGGSLDVTCFEDPVPAEIGAGLARSYGVPLMCEAWQVPPPQKDFRRLMFHAFALGAKSYQLVGDWEKMEVSGEEFRQTAHVFAELAEAEPVRAPVAGMVSYRTILSQIPARNYINPTLALIPKLQEHQYSLDWHSDLTPLDDLDRYPALLDANSEVLSESVVGQLERYVAGGGRLALLPRSGRYTLEIGEPDFQLLTRLGYPESETTGPVVWSHGRGRVLRILDDHDWQSSIGEKVLLDLMEWLGVQRPIVATPGLLAAVSKGPGETLHVALFWPKDEKISGSFVLRHDLVRSGKPYRVRNTFELREEGSIMDGELLKDGYSVECESFELKVLRIDPV